MTDELKPVRCGCGGEARIDTYLGKSSEPISWCVYCKKCEIQTNWYGTEAEAIQAWNRAMGERIAKVKESWGLAMCCACEKRVFPYDNYCSHCGARLEWNYE